MTTVAQTWTSQRRQTFGDYGNRCMTAFGTYLWPLHLEHCEKCRAVQAAWDAEKRKRGAG